MSLQTETVSEQGATSCTCYLVARHREDKWNALHPKGLERGRILMQECDWGLTNGG